jgi:hypothetical protein
MIVRRENRREEDNEILGALFVKLDGVQGILSLGDFGWNPPLLLACLAPYWCPSSASHFLDRFNRHERVFFSLRPSVFNRN